MAKKTKSVETPTTVEKPASQDEIVVQGVIVVEDDDTAPTQEGTIETVEVIANEVIPTDEPVATESNNQPIIQKTVVEQTAKEEKKPNVTIEDLLKQANVTLNFDDADEEVSEEEITESKNFIKNFMAFIQGNKFNKRCEYISKKYKVPKKQVAKSFFMKVLGTLSDVLHIGIGAIEDCCSAIITILSTILISGVNIICNVARNLVRLVTLNQTVAQV